MTQKAAFQELFDFMLWCIFWLDWNLLSWIHWFWVADKGRLLAADEMLNSLKEAAHFMFLTFHFYNFIFIHPLLSRS